MTPLRPLQVLTAVAVVAVLAVVSLGRNDDPLVCFIESHKSVASPSKGYEVEISDRVCDWGYSLREAELRRTPKEASRAAAFSEVLWKGRGYKSPDDGIVAATWLSDSTVKLRIPAGSRGTLEPELDAIKIVYEEY